MKKGAVFCDLDDTLYPGLTLQDTATWFLAHGLLSKRFYIKMLWWLILHKLDKLDYEGAFRAGVTIFEGKKESELKELFARSYRSALKPRFRRKVVRLLKEWGDHGPVVIATASLRLLAEPMAKDLGLAGVIGTELEVKNGQLTGQLKGPVLMAEAKSTAVAAWAKKNRVDLAHSLAVGGRAEDVPLLTMMAKGVVINPDPATRKLASVHGWQIIDAPRSAH